jgi:hypothetical protein
MFIFDDKIASIDEGVWVTYEGSQFLVAHSSNMKFQRALARLQAPHRRRIEKGSVDPGEMKNILCQSMAEAVILDWKDVKSKDGETVPYSVQNGTTALKNSDEFREFIQEFSSELANFKAGEEDKLGND